MIERGSRRALCLLLGGLCWLSSGARADWLALLPPCALPAPSEPVFAVLYPRPELPAVVRAGERLVARVRVPAALTPPPGAQQPAVLSPWSASLLGPARAILGAPARPLVYPLPPIDLRPDGPASLVYRLSLPIPAWAAPGSYDLWLRGPGGEARLPVSVYVRDGPRWPPITRARVPAGGGPGQAEAVRLRLGTEAAAAVASVTPARAPYAVVRYRDGLFEVGEDAGCARAQSAWRAGVEADLGLPGRGRLSAVASVDGVPDVRERVATDGFFATLAPASAPAVMRLQVPVRAGGYRVTGARRHRFFPVGEWHGRPPQRLSLSVALAPGATLSVRPLPSASGPLPRAPDPPATLSARAGAQVQLGWAAGPGGRIALRLSADDTRYAHRIGGVIARGEGPSLWTGVSVTDRGQVRLRQAHVRHEPARQGCTVGVARPASRAVTWSGRALPWTPLLLGLALLKRRAGVAGGNRLAPRRRFRR